MCIRDSAECYSHPARHKADHGRDSRSPLSRGCSVSAWTCARFAQSWCTAVDGYRRCALLLEVGRNLIVLDAEIATDGFDHQGLQHLLVDIRKRLDIEAALAGRMLAELCEQRLRVAETGHVVQNSCGLTRRKTDKRHIAFAPAVVRVVVAAEAYD